MARSCGSAGAGQVTEKTGKGECPRRSRAMTSSAFLSAATLAHRRARASELMAAGMVEGVRGNDGAHRFGNEVADAAAFRNPLGHFRGGDIDPALDAGEVVGGGAAVALEDDKTDEGLQFRGAAPA